MSAPASGRSPDMSAPLIAAPSPDPRVGLKAGLQDAGEAIWNLKKVIEHAVADGLRRGSPTPTLRSTARMSFRGKSQRVSDLGYFQPDAAAPARRDALPRIAE